MSTMSSRWLGFDGVYGGYVVARVVDKLDSMSEYLPVSVNIQFCGSVREGDIDLQSDFLHSGGSTQTVRAQLDQGHPKIFAQGKLASVSDDPELSVSMDISSIPGPESVEIFDFYTKRLNYYDFLEHRVILADEEQMRKKTSAWVRFTEEVAPAPELGAYGVCAVLLDVQPPGMLFGAGKARFVPTIDFSVHYEPGFRMDRFAWHYVTQETVMVSGSFCVEDSKLYDTQGHLLAVARQTRKIVW